MNQQYRIVGMTCNGCRQQVETILKDIPPVIDASVDLATSIASVQSEELLHIKDVQEAVPDKYIISEIEKNRKEVVTNDNLKQKQVLGQLFPLFLIFGYITVASIGINYKSMQLDGFMLDFMGLFYIVFSFFKFLDIRGFVASFKMYDPLAKVVPVYGFIYPFVEVTLGITLLARYKVDVAMIVTILVLGLTTVGVIKVLMEKKDIQCACLGTVLKLPMTKATFIENVIMLLMATLMLLKN